MAGPDLSDATSRDAVAEYLAAVTAQLPGPPAARVAVTDELRDGLLEALLLLCGPPGDWHPSQLTTLRHRYPDILAVHHLTREATPGALYDLDGQAFARLGVDGTAQYLIRPDGHVGYRAGGSDLAGLQHYLTRWLPNITSRPA